MVLRTDYGNEEQQGPDTHADAHNDANAVVNQLETDVATLLVHANDPGWIPLTGSGPDWFLSDADGSFRATFASDDPYDYRVKHGVREIVCNGVVALTTVQPDSFLYLFWPGMGGMERYSTAAKIIGTWTGDLAGARAGFIVYSNGSRAIIADYEGFHVQGTPAAGDEFRAQIWVPTSASDTVTP